LVINTSELVVAIKKGSQNQAYVICNGELNKILIFKVENHNAEYQ
jgi:hypothetical protein